MSKGWHRAEHGDSSIMLLLIVPVLFLLIGLIVDGGGKIQADEEATLIAQSAARAGVNAAVLPTVSGRVRISSSQAVSAAHAYLARAGVDGHATASTSGVSVTAYVDYRPKLLPLGTLRGEGRGRAEALTNQ